MTDNLQIKLRCEVVLFSHMYVHLSAHLAQRSTASDKPETFVPFLANPPFFIDSMDRFALNIAYIV
jgi:hypothetical protein